MEREPNVIISGASQRIIEDSVPFKVKIIHQEGAVAFVNGGSNVITFKK